MQRFIITLLSCSVTMSALALLYIALTPLLSRRYSEKGRYYAWLIVVIGLVIPFRPQFGNAFLKISIPIEAAAPVIQPAIGTPGAYPAAFPAAGATLPPTTALDMPWWSSISWWQVAALVWLAGVIVILAYHAIKHYRFVKIARRWSEIVTDERSIALLQSLKSEMGISGRVGLYQCLSVYSPMMIGFFHHRILLPKTDFTEDELRFILMHELVHCKRKDLYYKFLILIAISMHWFNPIAYLIARAIYAQCEYSCDAEVVRRSGADMRRHYSEMIIGVVKNHSRLSTALSTSFYSGKKSLRKRIFSIMDTGRKKTGVTIILAALVITATTGFALAATGINPSAPLPEASTQLESTGGIPKTESTSGIPNAESTGSILNAESNYKGLTLKIESAIKNDKVAIINYSIQDEQNMLGEEVVIPFWIKGEVLPVNSRAVRAEDGKLHGTINAFSPNGFSNDNIELQVDQLRYNQLIGQTTMLDIDLSVLKAPDVQNFNNQLLLQPDGYNYKLPINEGEGEAWISNIGAVDGKLHVQIKTIDPSAHDGVVANDVQPFMTDKNGATLSPESSERFHIGDNGQIELFSESTNRMYIIGEYVFNLGQNSISDLDLGFYAVPSSYLNGPWTVSYEPESVTGNIARDLSGLQTGKLTLLDLTVTPLYTCINFDAKSFVPDSPVDVPALVITYKDGHETECSIYPRIFSDNWICQVYYIAGVAGNELIELSDVRSITLGGLEILNIGK